MPFLLAKFSERIVSNAWHFGFKFFQFEFFAVIVLLSLESQLRIMLYC